MRILSTRYFQFYRFNFYFLLGFGLINLSCFSRVKELSVDIDWNRYFQHCSKFDIIIPPWEKCEFSNDSSLLTDTGRCYPRLYFQYKLLSNKFGLFAIGENDSFALGLNRDTSFLQNIFFMDSKFNFGLNSRNVRTTCKNVFLNDSFFITTFHGFVNDRFLYDGVKDLLMIFDINGNLLFVGISEINNRGLVVIFDFAGDMKIADKLMRIKF